MSRNLFRKYSKAQQNISRIDNLSLYRNNFRKHFYVENRDQKQISIIENQCIVFQNISYEDLYTFATQLSPKHATVSSGVEKR